MGRGALWVVLVVCGLTGTAVPSMAQTPPASKLPAVAPALAPPKTPDGAASKATVAAAGRRAADFCANCHGEDGNSKAPDVPNLAGQNRTYLAAQLQKFVSGERKNRFKEGLIKLLPPQDLPLIAAYYADSSVKPAIAAPSPNVAHGYALYRRYCLNCHGADGRGTESMPRVAGQQVDYLRQSLTRYRNRSGERIFAPMSAVMGALRDEDLAAVATYVAGVH